jgi:hypothetical protein
MSVMAGTKARDTGHPLKGCVLSVPPSASGQAGQMSRLSRLSRSEARNGGRTAGALQRFDLAPAQFDSEQIGDAELVAERRFTASRVQGRKDACHKSGNQDARRTTAQRRGGQSPRHGGSTETASEAAKLGLPLYKPKSSESGDAFPCRPTRSGRLRA